MSCPDDGDEVVVLAEDDDTYSAADAPFPCSEEAAPSPAASHTAAVSPLATYAGLHA